MEHNFTGPPYTLGVEEELMIVDAESMDLVSAIEEMMVGVPSETEGEVKPELMQSVLEISTDVCRNVGEAAGQLEDLRRRVRETAEPKRAHDRLGRHPSVREVGGPADRRADRATSRSSTRLRFVARQELLFGLHVHVGIDDPEKAIHVANGMRVHLPILLALSTQLPVLARRADRPDVDPHADLQACSRASASRRGIDGWTDYQARIDFMVEAGAVEDYTYFWWDVRPHPKLGTVEVRVCDAQTRLEHTVGARRTDPGDVQGACRSTTRRATSSGPTRARCWRRTSGWRPATGIEGELVDLPTEHAAAGAVELARRLVERLRPHAQELGSERELEAIEDIVERGTGAQRSSRSRRADRA